MSISGKSKNVLPIWQRLATQQELLENLSAAEIDALYWYWPFWARADQLPPAGAWTCWLMMGGRGAGKTRAGAEWIRSLVEATDPQNARRHIALVGETYGAARAVMVEGPSGLLAIAPPGFRPRFYPSRNLLVWPNGAQAQIFSSERPEALRGPQFDAAWCDELAKWRHDRETFDMLQFGLRLGPLPQQLITTTPRTTNFIKKLLTDPNIVVTRASTIENAANLAPAFLEEIVARYRNTQLGRQELDGELVENTDAALWTPALVDRQRCIQAPPIEKIDEVFLALDPPASIGPKADACGVVVVARHGAIAYVIADETVRGLGPAAWAAHVVEIYDRYQADALIAEINQGGEMVREIVLRQGAHVHFKPVRAHVGKLLRAEPVVALYERGLVFHVGHFQELEEEMCAYAGHGASPDRLDALVWAVSALLLNQTTAFAAPSVRQL